MDGEVYENHLPWTESLEKYLESMGKSVPTEEYEEMTVMKESSSASPREETITAEESGYDEAY